MHLNVLPAKGRAALGSLNKSEISALFLVLANSSELSFWLQSTSIIIHFLLCLLKTSFFQIAYSICATEF